MAYLVIRDGSKWADVFRLIPGRTVTIGRAATNQIVIREEQASRQHAEVFQTDGKWTIRDMSSRNGTAVGGDRLVGDRILQPGDVIWIAKTQLVYVNDLTTAYDKKLLSRNEVPPETLVGLEMDDQPTESIVTAEPTTITHRRQRPNFLVSEDDTGKETVPKVGRAATRLCRLAFELANETSAKGIARMALDTLVEITHIDAGAVLMLTRGRPRELTPEDLEVVAWHSSRLPEYQRVSHFLGQTVLREGEAVLARDIQDDSALGIRDSKGEIQATSVICAPIRVNNRIVGLVHLYATTPEVYLDPDDLEFTLAVAETMGLALKTRFREQKLVEDLSKTRTEIDLLREQLGVQSEIVGSSAAMLQVHQQIAQAAPSNATVLIRGESGVGKELVARAVHFSSPRKVGPFVCLNCAALTESLLESELFGHERGAFTGATDRKVGKFEAADKGTLMLDEIGEMSPTIQAKFLRVLEGHPFERVGGSKSIKVDVRVIAATNRDLEKAVREGVFRKDLFFRLHVVRIDVPPLRKRPEDIPELANYFLHSFNKATGRRINGFSISALSMLTNYRWPGNVRELRNVIERAVVLTNTETIEAEDLVLTNLSASESQIEPTQMTYTTYQPLTLEEVEARHIEATLHACKWNKSRAATTLGIERSTLDRKIKRYDIKE
ncbi:MAG: sigma 54-interacting transcriptional regulator [Pirellulaceae bacterium]|nr:sigma 54-interacting transcriptional regulator [Pirellulaceae bacterium]